MVAVSFSRDEHSVHCAPLLCAGAQEKMMGDATPPLPDIPLRSRLLLPLWALRWQFGHLPKEQLFFSLGLTLWLLRAGGSGCVGGCMTQIWVIVMILSLLPLEAMVLEHWFFLLWGPRTPLCLRDITVNR